MFRIYSSNFAPPEAPIGRGGKKNFAPPPARIISVYALDPKNSMGEGKWPQPPPHIYATVSWPNFMNNNKTEFIEK